MYVLDTDILIEIIRNNTIVIEHLKKVPDSATICTTLINIAELYYGAFHSSQAEKNLSQVKKIESTFRVLCLTKLAIVEYGKIKSFLKKQGTLIADNDLFIASITKANGGTLVTHNTKHFEKVPDLELEDWFSNLMRIEVSEHEGS